MERLTHTMSVRMDGDDDFFVMKEDLNKAFNKLGRLEIIEQDVGIPLEVLFKALRQGIWIREYPEDEPSFHRVAISCFKGRWFISTDFERIMNVNCFKGAWGFTKEELE